MKWGDFVCGLCTLCVCVCVCVCDVHSDWYVCIFVLCTFVSLMVCVVYQGNLAGYEFMKWAWGDYMCGLCTVCVCVYVMFTVTGMCVVVLCTFVSLMMMMMCVYVCVSRP